MAGQDGGVTEAFYTPAPEPGTFTATPHTVGPWSATLQHAGPPCALLTRAVERLPSPTGRPVQLTRLTFEILGPVPVGQVGVEARVVRPGRSVELVEALLTAGGRPAVRAAVWRMRVADVALPPLPGPPPLPPPSAACSELGHPLLRRGYLRAVEWRFLSGHFDAEGPAEVWARQRVPLVAGEEPSPVQRLVAIADSGNGLSRLFPFDGWLFVNTDLTLHLHRPPDGEWVGVRATSTADRTGVGLAETELYDAAGRVGRGAQSLLVERR
jgi:hypothetical protein